MKWLFLTVFCGLVVGLLASFPRAQDDAAPSKPAENPRADGTPATINAARPTVATTDRKGDVIAADEPAKPAAPARQEPKPPSDDEEVKIFQLKHAEATATRDLVQSMYPAELKNRSKIAADVRTNTLVMRGSRDLLAVIEAILIRLDEDETPKRPERTPAGVAQSPSGDARGLQRSRASSAREDWLESLSMAANPDGEVGRVKEELRRQEQQAVELARQYRQAQGAPSPDGPALQKLKAELEAAVQAAFDARQKVQSYELDQLRQRLARIENRLAMRARAEPDIIRQRIEQLLHPERDWEAAGETGPPGAAVREAPAPVRRQRTTAERVRNLDRYGLKSDDLWMKDYAAAQTKAQKLHRPLFLHQRDSWRKMDERRKTNEEVLSAPEFLEVLEESFVAVVQTLSQTPKELHDVVLRPDGTLLARFSGYEPAKLQLYVEKLKEIATNYASEEQPESPASSSTAKNATLKLPPDMASDPRKTLLDAESAISDARSAIVAAEKKYKFDQAARDRDQDLYRQGLTPQKTVLDAEAALAAEEGRLVKAKLDLQLAERQSKLARENLASQITLLEIDLADAGLRLDQARKEESRARALLERSAIAKEEYEAKLVAVEQAKLQVRRIETRLELYRKALPGDGRHPGLDQEDGKAISDGKGPGEPATKNE